MFEEFSEYLTQNSKHTDYWYNDASMEASKLLLNFTEQDWQKLVELLPLQTKDWQSVCFELIAQDDSEFAQRFILNYLIDKNEFLQYHALDTLNEHLISNFLSSIQKDKFKNLLKITKFSQNEINSQFLLASVLKKLNE